MILLFGGAETLNFSYYNLEHRSVTGCRYCVYGFVKTWMFSQSDTWTYLSVPGNTVPADRHG